jgi:hypothetical protein
MGRAQARLVPIDRADLDELCQRLLEAKRSRLPCDRDLLLQMLQRILANVLPRSVAHHQQLRCGHQRSGLRRDQHLREHRGQRHRKLLPHGVLALRGEPVSDSGDRRPAVGRMDGGEHEMACFRRPERHPHRLRVAHLADDNDVGRLPEGRPQRSGEIGHVDADFDICSTMLRWCAWSYSIGSSTMTMCRASRALISAMSAAAVVVLPDPVGPPISTRPRGASTAC